ncbi:putative membrane protein [Pseudarthrobacter phenanthrenivorans Sphe3]|uniref:Putative membrane protein n=1 Tax=Pseudarthrobacter phenanthrenivorans (strain DSM 18606 / JCM 16027 / LMG 23796 / Sphe3) TaxID=930171 RepID=F0M2Z5_PSEPM|nr:DUF2177 family protein [Pseudarthrobacter phenanthrenivorans]ADX72153.1 putative membrane protein [Pseudarthrobacter phenanthrenivorans Sphe3]
MNTRTRKWLLAYAATAVIFAVLDLAWISVVASNLYQSQIGHLIAPSPNAAGAAAFYLIFVAGMVHYGVRPNDTKATMRQRVTGAALFGFFTYATWALTGYAVLRDFTLLVAVTDILWGAAACSLVTWLTATLLRRRVLAK